jgi:hypothetical protein
MFPAFVTGQRPGATSPGSGDSVVYRLWVGSVMTSPIHILIFTDRGYTYYNWIGSLYLCFHRKVQCLKQIFCSNYTCTRTLHGIGARNIRHLYLGVCVPQTLYGADLFLSPPACNCSLLARVNPSEHRERAIKKLCSIQCCTTLAITGALW